MVIVTVLLGAIVGALVGISGIGGAVLLLPMLIIGMQVPSLTAVGSDAVFAALTKVGAALVHWRQKTVDLRLTAFLALGSIPGAIAGFNVLAELRQVYGEGINAILRLLIGILLLVVPFIMLGQTILLKRLGEVDGAGPSRTWPTILIGLLGGFLVGLTSVGSGSIILVLLLLTFRRAPAILVGTDIVHAVLLTGLTGTMHIVALSSVDFKLVGLLLLGSLPGAYFGARWSRRVPVRKLRLALLLLLVCSGAVLLAS